MELKVHAKLKLGIMKDIDRSSYYILFFIYV